MDIARIVFRLFLNFLNALPRSPRQVRVQLRWRRRELAWRAREAERLDRIRNPEKYLGSRKID